VSLTRDRPNGSALPARVGNAVYVGTHIEYTLESALGSLFVTDRVHGGAVRGRG
jgi:hypothetical protein